MPDLYITACIHEMLGHLGWKTIKRGLAHVTGKTFHLKRGSPLDKCYIDLSGHISDQSFDAKTPVGIVTETLADKEREVQMYLAYHRGDDEAPQSGK